MQMLFGRLLTRLSQGAAYLDAPGLLPLLPLLGSFSPHFSSRTLLAEIRIVSGGVLGCRTRDLNNRIYQHFNPNT